jgi:hypothetical protein
MAETGGTGQVGVLQWPQQPEPIYKTHLEFAGAPAGLLYRRSPVSPAGAAPPPASLSPPPKQAPAVAAAALLDTTPHRTSSCRIWRQLPQHQLPEGREMVARRRVLPHCQRRQVVRAAPRLGWHYVKR